MAKIIKLTNGKCRVCGDEILEEINENEFIGFGPPIDGPGGEKQWANISKGFYCKGCGIQYRFVPKNK